MLVGEDGGDEGADGGFGGQVGRVDCGFAAEGFDGLLCGLVAGVALGGGFVLEQVGFGEMACWIYLHEEDVCAGFCEGNGHCLADSSCAACYEGGLALEGEELLDGCHGVCVCVTIFLSSLGGWGIRNRVWGEVQS